MKTAIFSTLRLAFERRQRQRKFIERGLASRAEAARTGTYVSSDAVLSRIEKILAQAKSRNCNEE